MGIALDWYLQEVPAHLGKCLSLSSCPDQRVSELHSLSCQVCHSKGWKSCIFLLILVFVAETQEPRLCDQRFEEFALPSLADFVDEDREEMLLCPLCVIKRYLSRTEHFRPEY